MGSSGCRHRERLTDPPDVNQQAQAVRLIGRYALYRAIASGGMATVFLGRLLGPVGFARTVAVKRLHPQFAQDPEFVSMFLDEARLAARIRHPNVVPTLDVVATKGELFLVMEYVHGESLAKLIRAARDQDIPIPVPVAAAILSGVLQGLHAAHEARSERGLPLQIVHRDVSPQNILVGNDGQARVLDFGVARASGRAQSTRDGQLKGKLAYMPPEQLRGEEVGPWTDVYAASVVLWEALTSVRLFQADNEGALVTKILTGLLTPPSDALAPDTDPVRRSAVQLLDAIVMSGLARHPRERWSSALDMARALESAVVPATAAQVARWVEGAARAELLERATLVAEIESNSAIDVGEGGIALAMAAASAEVDPAESPQDNPSFMHAPLAPTRVGSAPSLPYPPPVLATMRADLDRTWQDEPRSAAGKPLGESPPTSAAASSSSLSNAAWVPAKRRLAPSVILTGIVAGVVAITTAAVVIGFLVYAGRSSGNGVSGSTPPAVSSEPSAAPTSSPPAPSASVAAAPALAIPPSEPRAAPSPSSPVATPRTSAAPPKKASTMSLPRAGSCDPPFTYDAKGVKQYKPECF
jgi:eukaryotic-like serine/threonine-protein kinase